jgi:hypothetical protein
MSEEDFEGMEDVEEVSLVINFFFVAKLVHPEILVQPSLKFVSRADLLYWSTLTCGVYTMLALI